MQPWIAELIGTAILLYLGGAVVANMLLDETKGKGGGIVVIAIAWGLAVMLPAMVFGYFSGAHFNPALSLALAVTGDLAWGDLPMYIVGQLIGAMIGAFFTWLHYRDHFDITKDKEAKLACFSTGPAISRTSSNFISEMMGTFILVFVILGFANQPFAYGVNVFAVYGLIVAIGMSLGGTTGYAINPVRDLGPRVVYAFLPIKDKRDPNWGYAWIPVVAPMVGGVLAALLAMAIF